MRTVLVVLTLALAGCASAPLRSAPMHDGPAVDPPPGWSGYCLAHPEDPSC